MVHTSHYFEYSDETRKMEILTRLVKEGSITLEEAFFLSEREPAPVPPYVPSINPYWITSTPTPGTGTFTIPATTFTTINEPGLITTSTQFNPENTSWSYTN